MGTWTLKDGVEVQMLKDVAGMGTDGGASGGWPPWNHKSRSDGGESGGTIEGEVGEDGDGESDDDESGEGS